MDSRIPVSGALLASLGSALSWICCLPVALAALGSSGAVLATSVGPWRPYLNFFSILFLALGFFLVYRAPAPCPADVCPTWRPRLQRALLWTAAGITAIMLTVGYWGSWVIYWML